MSQPHDTVLTTSGLSVHYDTTVALRDVDLTVREGDLIALVGRNGAGKTTLLSALADAVPHHGDVRWQVERARVAYVPQRAHPRWDMPLDVRHVVASGCLDGRRWWRRPSPQQWETTYAAIDRLGLGPLARKPVRSLSGGQAQRVLLARALAQEPRVLLLDEPYDGLDKANVAALNTVLRELAADGVAVIAAVHELNVVRNNFARVIALDGRVIADGTPEEAFAPEALLRMFGVESAA